MVENLVEKAQNGDSEAYGEIYELYVDKIFRFIFYKVRSKEEAEDLTATTFEKALDKLSTFKKNVSFQAWLFMIARNTLIDYWRTYKKTLDIEKHHNIHSDEDIMKKLIKSDEQRMVLSGLDKLEANHKEILILRFIGDLSVKETSKILKKSLGATRVLQTRALKTLKEVLEKKYERRKNYK